MTGCGWKGLCRQTLAALFCKFINAPVANFEGFVCDICNDAAVPYSVPINGPGKNGSLGTMTTGFMMGWPAAAFPKIRHHDTNFQLSIFEESWTISCMSIGIVVGTLPSSIFMDNLGRKPGILIFCVFSLLSWLVIAHATSIEMLYLGRLLGGIFAGGMFTISPNYLAEILEPKVRGSLGSISTIVNATGTLIAFWLAPKVTYKDLALISSVPTVIFMFCFLFAPETPYLLIMKKKYVKARKNLAWLRGTNDVQGELDSIQTFIETEKRKPHRLIDVILDDKYKWPFLSCIGLLIIQKGSGYFTVLANQNIILPSHVGVLKSEDSTLIIGFIGVVCSFFAAFCMDLVGRKVLLQMSNIGQGVSMLVLGFWHHYSIESEFGLEDYNIVPLMALFTYAVTFSIGLGPVPHIYLGEVLPPLVKARATGLIIAVAQFAIISINEIFAVVTTYSDMYVNFFCFGVCSLMAIIYVQKFIIETNGKSLQMIQKEFRERRTMKGEYFIIE